MRNGSVLVLALGWSIVAQAAGASLLVAEESITVEVEASVLTTEPVADSELAVDEDASDGLSTQATASAAAGVPQVSVTTTANAVIATDRIDVDFSTHWEAASDGSVGVLYGSNHAFAAVLTIPADGELRIAWELGKAVSATPNAASFHGFDYSLDVAALGEHYGPGAFGPLDVIGGAIVLPVAADDVLNLAIQGTPNAGIDADFTMAATLDASITVEYVPEPEAPLLAGAAWAGVLALARTRGSLRR